MASHYLIIDLEATCANDASLPRDEMEIIEIGAVIVSCKQLVLCDQFQCFIRPQRHPKLTDFCQQLTSIKPSDVNQAVDFTTAINALKSWLTAWPDYLFCSWGDYDKRQLQQDCNYHAIDYPLLPGHLNIKQAFAKNQHLDKAVELAPAMALIGLPLNGTLHRGIDDALNMAKLMPHIIAS